MTSEHKPYDMHRSYQHMPCCGYTMINRTHVDYNVEVFECCHCGHELYVVKM